MVEGGLSEDTSPCHPCVKDGRDGPLRLYVVPLVVSVVGDENVCCRQFVHLGGVGEVAGDGYLGCVALAAGSVGDDVVGRPFVVGGFFRRVQALLHAEGMGTVK